MKALSIVSLAAGVAVAAPALGGEAVDYTAGGADYRGYYAAAEGEPAGLVLIVHDWDGLTDYERERADMLAELGYDAFALDLYGAGNRPVETEAKKAETAKLYEDREAMRSRLLAGLVEAREHSNAAEAVVMGYCFGGAAVLELARSGQAENVAGYATFHGGLATPEGQSYPEDVPPILVAHGAADQSITMDQVAALVRELEEAGATFEVEIYSGAPHAFTVFGEERYQERADRKSWEAFKTFLENQLADGA